MCKSIAIPIFCSFRCVLPAALLLCLSCSKSTIEDVDFALGYEYYPLQMGQSATYALDSIIFDPAEFGVRVDTLSGFLREDVVDTLRDNTGDLIYRIERYYRKSENTPWRFHSVVTAARSKREATYTEDNLRFVKLLFPLKPDLEWSGTAHFPENTELVVAGETLEFFKGWQTTVLEKRAQYEVDGRNYSDVFLVELAKFENKIEYRYGLEAYAPELGLVYQEIRVLDTQCDYCCNRDLGACDPLPWAEKAEKGVILKKRLLF